MVLAMKLLYGIVLAALIYAASAPLGYGQEPSIQAYTQLRNTANVRYDAEGRQVLDDIGSQMFRAMMAEADISYSLELAPWARITQYLDTRPNILAYTFVRTVEREPNYHWIGLVSRIESYLYGLQEREQELPRTLAAAREFRVGSIRNDAYDKLLHREEFSNIIHINNNADWLSLLERGRLDLVPFGEQAILEYLQQRDEPLDRLVPLVRLEDLSTGVYFAASLETDPEIVSRLRAAYQTIVDNGTYAELLLRNSLERGSQ